MRKVRIALSGPGWIGEQLLHAIHRHPGAEVAGVSGPDETSARAAMARVGLDPSLYHRDFTGILADPRVEAVVLSGPNSSHAPQAIAALAAGKHVLSEKPNAVSRAEHQALVAAAQAAPHLVTMTDYIFHFDGMMERLCLLAERGAFGRLLQVQCNYRSPVNVSGNRAWKLRKDQVGDAIGMAITHALFSLLRIAGRARPVEVMGISHPGATGLWEVPPVWNMLVRFDDGCCGVVLGDIETQNGYDVGMQVHGSAGAFVFDSQAARERCVRYRCPDTGGSWVHPMDPTCDPAVRWPEGITTPISGNVIDRAVSACIDHFIGCLHSGRQSPLAFAAIRTVQDLSFAAQESAAIGRPVALAGAD
jgi:predicted dehydrogenase